MDPILAQPDKGYCKAAKALVKHEFPKFNQKTQKLQNRDLVREHHKAEKKVLRALPECKFIGERIDKERDEDAVETAKRLSQDVPPHRIVLFVRGCTSHTMHDNKKRKASAAIAYRTSEQKSNWVRRLFRVECGQVDDLHLDAELLAIAEALAIALVWAIQEKTTCEKQPEVVLFSTSSRTLRYVDCLRDENVARKEAYPARNFAVPKLISRSQWLHRLGVRVQLRRMPGNLSAEGMVHAQAAGGFALGRPVIPLLRDEGLEFMTKEQDQQDARASLS